MDKNEELQKWLNDDRYVQRKELEKLWHISKTGVYNTLREKKIKPTKKIYMGRIGNYTFFNKKECECARPFKSKIEELHDWIDSDIYVQTKELASMWGISMTGTSHFLRTKKIHPVKIFRFGIDGGKYVFYDRAECISARTSLYENEELVKLINDDSCVQTHKLSEVWDMATTTVSACLRSDNIKPKKIINLGGGGGRFVFYDKKECESSILKQKNIREELQKWLNDDKYVRTTTLSETWGCTISSVSTLLRKYKIQPTKTIHAGRNGVFSFYDKAKCMSAKNDASGRKDELRSWLDDKNYIRPEELKDILGLNSSAVTYFLRKRNIKPVKRFFSGNRGGSFVFYDRAVCMNVNSDCNTFINQPEKEVEKVEQVNLPEPKEQTPDIIPADTIDLFTMPELESELKQRGVELTDEVKAKINASDMPEMQHIATMIRGDAKTIAIRLSVLNKIAGQLRDVEKKPCNKQKRIVVDYFPARGNDGVFYLYKKLKPCPFCGSDHIEVSCEELTTGYWVSKMLCNGCETRNEHDNSTKEVAAEELINFWNRRIDDKVDSEAKTISDKGICVNQDLKDKLRFMAMADNVDLTAKLESIIMAAWIMGNYDNK